MATVSSTSSSTTSTATTSTTTTKTAAQVASEAAKSLMDSMDAGSGVDTASLVSKLVDAQFATRKAQLTAKYDTLTSQISGASKLKSTIDDFTKALETLVKGGTLGTQPLSSNATAVTATTIQGQTVGTLNTTVKVNALATAQTTTSAKVASPAASATFGTGTLTLKLGTATYASGEMTAFTTGKNTDGSDKSFAITIDSSNNTLSGIATAINAQKAGVTATVVTDADGGAYLSLRGQLGEEQAFQLSADNSSSALAAFDVRPRANGEAALPTTLASAAANASITVDGATVGRASNEVSDLVPGVKLTLTAPGTTTISSSRPTTALSGAVKDFVDTYNQVLAVVKEETDPINGELRADPAAKTLLRSLQSITSKVLLPNAASGTPASLSAIGVRTNAKTGELEVDDTTLTAALKNTPDAVEQMFAYSAVSGTGLYQAMSSIRTASASTVYGLGASTTRYRQAQSDLTKKQDTITDQSDRATKRLTQQFASMNSRVSAYKATQAFMQQKIDMWTKQS
ncbi:flagellar filament capping protein FliD [Sphingomonas adhaesiva]|uniref:flagellar filament capping protein FliD n=1 Tax=Sphingomonas adhaesiva TaxID=28212 RepID=UPI002FFAB81D